MNNMEIVLLAFFFLVAATSAAVAGLMLVGLMSLIDAFIGKKRRK